MIGVDAGRDAGGLGIRGVASWGGERRGTAENDEWPFWRRVSRSRRRVVGGQWEWGSRKESDARPSVGGGGGGFGRSACQASSTGDRGEHHSTGVCWRGGVPRGAGPRVETETPTGSGVYTQDKIKNRKWKLIPSRLLCWYLLCYLDTRSSSYQIM